MSYLEKLLEGAEVKWKTIDDLFRIKNGYTPSKSNQEYWTNGTIPWFRMEDIRTNGRVLSDSIQHVSDSAVKGQLIPENSLLMSTTATIGEYALILVPYLTNQQITNFSVKNSFIDKVSIKYLFYCFFDFGKWCIENANKNGGLSIIGANKLKEYTIPIPPLSVQKEIVRILDTFTELTAELTAALTAELTARKKQCNYYRDSLLNFEEGEVEWKTLGEVAVIGTGSRNTNEAVVNGKYPFFVRSQEARTINEFEFDETSIITAGDGVGVGKVFHYMVGKYALHQRAYRIVTTDKLINSKFLFHFMRNNFGKYLETNSVHASVTSLRKPMFERYLVPMPPLEEQARIVSILDKFDTITSSISEGLPAEIEMRKKQYEHYRNLLLTFPKENLTP